MLGLGALWLWACGGAIDGAPGEAVPGGAAADGRDGAGAGSVAGRPGAGDDAAGDGSDDARREDGAPDPCLELSLAGAPVPMRRLTAEQLEATVADVLGVAQAYPVSDETLLGYRANTSSGLDATTARVVLDAAEDVVLAAAPRLLGDPRCADDGCAALLLDELAPQLFRRPLDAETRARFAALHAEGVAAEGEGGGLRWALAGLLQSPRFLYLLEPVEADGKLDGHAVAARLSYALWGGPPDATLLADAEGGALDDAAGVAAAADRMIDDARFERGLEAFVEQWLSLEELDDVAVRPDVAELAPDVREALHAQPVALLAEHIRADAPVSELLRFEESPWYPELDAFYGDDLLAVEGETARLDPDARAGLLMLPGVLAALSHAEQTSPTLRGRAVLDSLLCRPPPPPPPDVNPTLPPSLPGATTRERLEAHLASDTCAGCHATMDGIGLAFEGFDWMGRSRELDNGKPIDVSARFVIDTDTIEADGPVALSHALADRDDVAACFARHYSRFAVGVREDQAFDCAARELGARAQGTGGLRSLLLGYVSSEWFRAPAPTTATSGEQAP